jgi:hypothetical protein
MFGIVQLPVVYNSIESARLQTMIMDAATAESRMKYVSTCETVE